MYDFRQSVDNNIKNTICIIFNLILFNVHNIDIQAYV